MKKFYGGIAAAALVATGIACTGGAAHAANPSWSSSPLGFTLPSQQAMATALSSDHSQLYTVAIDDNGDVEATTTSLATGVTSPVAAVTFSGDASFSPENVAVAATGTIVVTGGTDDGAAYAVGQVDAHAADVAAADVYGAELALSPDGSYGVIGNGTSVQLLDLTGEPTLEEPTDLRETVTSFDQVDVVAVTDTGTIEAGIERYDSSTESDTGQLVRITSAGAQDQVDLDGVPESLALLADGDIVAGVDFNDGYKLQYVDGSHPDVSLDDRPAQLSVSPDQKTIWATNGYDTVMAVRDGQATSLGSNVVTNISYDGIGSLAGTDDTLYVAATPYDIEANDGDGADGPAAIYALGTPAGAATDAWTSFDDDTLRVYFTGDEASTTPLAYRVTVTDKTAPGSSWTTTAWNAGHGDATELATFGGLDADKGYDVSVQAFNGGFLGASVATSYLPALPGSATVAVSGTPTVGQTLTANVTSTFPATAKATYQWGVVESQGEMGGLVDIAGATGTTFAPTANMVGKQVGVTVTFHEDGYADGYADSGPFGPIAAAGQPAPVPSTPTTVTTVKAAPIKSTSKKLKLTLPGVTNAPGKVKVYDGKKLIGKAKIVDGKLVLKLKKHLSHGKHKLKLNYKGSAQVAKFNKTVKVKVK